jgi:hypothetical protein
MLISIVTFPIPQQTSVAAQKSRPVEKFQTRYSWSRPVE